jgi:hypothetical protein
MPMMLIWALTLLSLTWALEPVLNETLEHPMAVAQASHELERYQTFLYMAQLFVKSHPTPGRYPWDQIKQGSLAQTQTLSQTQSQTQSQNQNDVSSSSALPASLLNASYPPSWTVVISDNGTWSTCTPLSVITIGMLEQWTTPAQLTVTGVDSYRYVVLGDDLNVYQSCS